MTRGEGVARAQVCVNKFSQTQLGRFVFN